MAKKQKKKIKKKSKLKRIRFCPNCGVEFLSGDEGHFCPPSFGEKGFFICKKGKKEN